MYKKYNNFFLFCPLAMTGGPEAIHQLHQKISANNGISRIIYIDIEHIINTGLPNSDASLPEILYADESKLEKVSSFKKYAPIEGFVNELDESSLAIIPEGLIWFRNRINQNIPRAIWWLSVDNALIAYPNLKYKSYKNELFKDNRLIHFYQSEYAKNFINEAGGQSYPLFDFIISKSEFQTLRFNKTPNKLKRICYFPSKGGDLANNFFKLNPNFEKLAIQDMSKEQVFKELNQSMVYLDFGHQPGKDRIPREACISKCIVFVLNKGAASNFVDYPIDNFFKFNLTDITSGSLTKRIQEVFSNPSQFIESQSYFRNKILNEETEFNIQVNNFLE